MLYHRRNLPHLYPTGATLFLTWRLFDSLPRSARPESAAVDRNVGKVFLDRDRELDRGARGPLWLKDARIARLVAEALVKGANEFRLYELLAWVVMPNHVHVVFTPFRPLPQITRWLKGSTARSANLLLDRTGMPFWQYESYDHLVRSGAELERIIGYIEWNPVSAGFAQAAEDWPWSSAGFDRSRA